LTSCATYSDRTEAARDAINRGDIPGGIEEFNKYMKVSDSESLPKKMKKNYELVILERGTALQAIGEYELSARDFQFADKQLELLDLSSKADKIGQYIYSDSAAKFRMSPTEKLSLNAMNMCNYLARGDLNGAKIEAKRFTVMRKYFSDYDPEHEHGAYGSYMAGFVYERLGNYNEALRYYDEALQEREFSSLRAVIPELAKKASYRGERIKDYLPPGASGTTTTTTTPKPAAKPAAPAPEVDPRPYVNEDESKPADEGEPKPEVQRPKSISSDLAVVASEVPAMWGPPPKTMGGEIFVVAKVGRVPVKRPERIPIGAAIGLAGAFITGDTTLLEYGMFKVVVYPELYPSNALFQTASLTVDGQALQLDIATDNETEIKAEFEELKPKIIGAALSRMIVRAAAAEGARAAGKQAEGAGALVGFLAAAAVEGTMVALDKPDTRSWTTLPARIYVGRTFVPPGKHRLVVTAAGRGGRERRTVDVTVPPGGFVVLDVTTLR
jgi:tetratricopeptide (TPR) repeat protein